MAARNTRNTHGSLPRLTDEGIFITACSGGYTHGRLDPAHGRGHGIKNPTPGTQHGSPVPCCRDPLTPGLPGVVFSGVGFSRVGLWTVTS